MKFIIGLFLILIGFSVLTGISLFKFFFAILLIILGVKMIMGRKSIESKSESSNENIINEVAVFGEIEKKIDTDNFEGGKVVVVFGNAMIDLRQAKSIKKNIQLEVTAAFAAAKVYIPKNWRVKSQGTGVLGSYSNITISEQPEVEIELTGAAIVGSVEIVN